MRTLIQIAALSLLIAFTAGCSAEVGSERWCGKMDKTSKADWTANDAKEYAENCILRKK